MELRERTESQAQPAKKTVSWICQSLTPKPGTTQVVPRQRLRKFCTLLARSSLYGKAQADCCQLDTQRALAPFQL